MFDKSFLEEMRKNLLNLKGDFKEVFIETSYETTIFSCKEGVFDYSGLIKCGLGLRIDRNGKIIFKKKKRPDLNKLLEFVKYFDNQEMIEEEPRTEWKITKSNLEKVFPKKEKAKIDRELKPFINEQIKKKRCFPRISLRKTGVSVINSEGVLTNEDREITIIEVNASSDDSEKYFGAASKIVCGAIDVYDLKKDLEEVCDEAAKNANFKKIADKKISGEMPIVLSSKAAGFLLNEAVSHFFESDLETKTNFSRFLGQKITKESITIFDNGPLTGLAQYDDEGVEPQKPLVMIENGKVANLLTHRNSAQMLSLKRSGHARRMFFNCRPVVGVWNIGLQPSKYDESEIIEKVPFGLYVKSIEDGYLSLKKGIFSFPVVESYVIRNGKIDEMVSNIRISGKTPLFLNDIELIGNKAETFGGFRKKGEEFYITFETVPPFLINKLSVSPVK